MTDTRVVQLTSPITGATGMARYLLAALLALVMAGFANAQGDCERGALDARYCDTNGDMLADPPADGNYSDTSTIVFTYAPTVEPAVILVASHDLFYHHSDLPGRPVQYFPVRSYAAQIEAMRAGRLHVAGFAAGSVEEGVNTAGFIPVAVMADTAGVYGYEMEIIVQPDSDIQSLEDLSGRQLAFVSPTSNSGFKAPSALLFAELGMKPDVDYQTAFSGGHDNS